jgi:hypothetical protein
MAQLNAAGGGSAAKAIFTRQGTTPYAANDVVGGPAAAIQFIGSPAWPDTGAVLITSAELMIDVNAVPSGMTSFRLYLYSATPPSALATMRAGISHPAIERRSSAMSTSMHRSPLDRRSIRGSIPIAAASVGSVRKSGSPAAACSDTS